MTNSKDTFTFNGFEPANTTPVPDVLFDELLSQLSGSELKTLLYIIRRTRGFKKDSDAISLSQFQKGIITKDGKQLDKGCGIDDRQTIINALASLEKKRCIVSEKVKTAKGDNATTVYRILFSQGVVGKANQGSREKSTTLVGNSNHRSGKKPTTVVGNSNPQETVLQETVLQETVLQEERESPPNTLDTHTIVSSDTAHTLPSKQDEQLFTDDAPQGDTHATAASGHPHRVGEPAAPGGDSGHTAVDDGQVAAPEVRPVLEAQEITEGDTHATRVPTLPRADHPASLERHASGHPQSDNHCAVGRHDDLPVVRLVGSGTPGEEAGRDTRDAGRDATQTLGQTPPTSMPAQSLSLPQAEQAASGAPKPLVEPDMSGKWSHEKCVEYAEWCNQKRYTEKMHEEQLKAAHAIHKNDVVLTLEQFKQSYDERNDAWWKEHKGKLHVNDMKARGASGIDRVHEMLQRIEDAASKCRAQPRLQVVARQSAIKRYSSYDDPNFSSENDFYPVEGGSYAAASI